MSIWMEGFKVVRTLNAAGFEAYIVGGAVRDYLLGKDVDDVDVATQASPHQVADIFSRGVHINREHQTVLVPGEKGPIEITTFKGETLVEDLQKRDFTINALAMTETREVIDPYGGRQDLQSRLLRSYDAQKRLSEDPLRMLRAARFISSLGFEADQQLVKETTVQKAALQRCALERVAAELEKLLKGMETEAAFSFLQETGAIHCLPGIHITERQLAELKRLPKQQWDSGDRAWLEFAICTGGSSSIAALPLPKKRKQLVAAGIKAFEYRQTQQRWSDWQLYISGLAIAMQIEAIRAGRQLPSIQKEELAEQWSALPIKAKSDLAITGRDLLHAKAVPGPWIKEALQAAEKAVVTKKCPNEKAAILAFLTTREEGK